MEKLNIAEILKDCPKGMELDCTICDNVCLDEVTPNMIKCFVKNDVYNTIYFHHDGTYLTNQNAKCVIFPKGKTTWEGFHRPFKDGDIVTWEDRGSLVACIYKERKNTTTFNHRIALYKGGLGIVVNGEIALTDDELCFATEEEKQKLFDAIKANGYEWSVEAKTLEKLIEPKFKVGDKIINKKGDIRLISKIMDDEYHFESGGFILFRDHDYWELVPNKFDISTLVPFESKVLVRTNNGKWIAAFYSHYDNDSSLHYCVVGGLWYAQCIPYKGNEYLLNTTNDCSEYYKTWE